MDIKKGPGPEPKTECRFDNDESKVLIAAFRERQQHLAQEGDASSITELDETVASYDPDDAQTRVTLSEPDIASIARELTTFSNNTDSVLAEIAASKPGFDNNDIGIRLRLGRLADGLVDEITAKVSAESQVDFDTADWHA